MLSLAGRLCNSCGSVRMCWSHACHRCGEIAYTEVNLPATGVLYSATTIRVPPVQLRHLAPYQIVLVQLDNGPRVIGRMEPGAVAHLDDRLEVVDQEGNTLIFRRQEEKVGRN